MIMPSLKKVLCLVLLCFVNSAFAPVFANEPLLQNNYAVELLQNKEYEKALEYFQDAYHLYPNDLTIKKNLAFAYVMVGEQFMGKGRFAEAADKYDHAGELYPDDPKLKLLRGIALYALKDYDNARFEFDRAIALGGETPETLFHLGRVYYDTGETDRALQLWEKALQLAPDNQDLQAILEKTRREAAVESAMGKGHGGKFLVTYDTAVPRDTADRIIDLLEGYYNSVGYDLGRYPQAKVPVILYARKDYKNITSSPDWSGGVYDGKIRIPADAIGEISPRIRATLRHEYTHAVVYDMTRGNCPVWLNEGLAEVEGRMEYDTPIVEAPRALKDGTFKPMKSLEGSFIGLERKSALLAYEQSYLMVKFMIKSYGWHKIQELLNALGSGLDIGAAFVKALGEYGLDYQKAQDEFMESVRKDLSDS